MKLLTNKRQFKKWVKDNGAEYQQPGFYEPVTYPCFAYAICQSFGYEELVEVYIYPDQLMEMVEEMAPYVDGEE